MPNERRTDDRLDELTILLGAYAVLYLPLTGYLYGRQRRWVGMFGWDLLVLGLLLAFGGAGDAFAWAGLLWSFVAAAGVLLIVMDVFEMRRRRE
jgi:hypothetical protein